MATHLQIDFVSDVACPWCVVGLKALDQALARVAPGISADLHFQPFELNPDMGPQGQDITEHLTQKYGISVAQAGANRENIRQRGAELGFVFTGPDEPGGGRNRVNNTFDAHRLLPWAALEDAASPGGKQKALKEAMFKALFTDGLSMASHEVLLGLVPGVGLSQERAKEILAGDTYTQEVREQQQFYLRNGINSVPSVIINQRHLISGGQPVEVFEQALRQIAAAS